MKYRILALAVFVFAVLKLSPEVQDQLVQTAALDAAVTDAWKAVKYLLEMSEGSRSGACSMTPFFACDRDNSYSTLDKRLAKKAKT